MKTSDKPIAHGEYHANEPRLPGLQEAWQDQQDYMNSAMSSRFSSGSDLFGAAFDRQMKLDKSIAQEERWIEDVRNMPPISADSLKNLLMEKGAVINPKADCGDRWPEFANGRIAEWEGESRRVDLPGGNVFAIESGNKVAFVSY